MSDARAPLRHPALRAFLLGRALSVLGVQVMHVAIGWRVYALTASALDLGLIGLVQFVPQALLFPLVGTVVDRVDRRALVVVCYAIAALCVGALAILTSHGGIGVIYAVLLVFSLSRAFSAPAGPASLSSIVPADEFAQASSWSSSVFTAATVTGPALGGGLYALGEHLGWGGAPLAFGTASALLALASLAMTRLPEVRAKHPGKPPGLRDALHGVAYIVRRPVLLGSISLDLFAVLFGGATALLPIYAADVLQTGPVGLGLLRAAPAVGALVTALWLAHNPIRRRLGWVLHVVVAIFGLATLGFALSQHFWLSLCCLALAGMADEISVFIRLQVVQLATPDALRGRVTAAEFVFIGASNELGQLESGLTAAWWGAVPAAVVGGLGSVVVAILSAIFSRQLRQMDRIDDLRAQATPSLDKDPAEVDHG